MLKNVRDDDDDDEPVFAADKARFRKEFETQMVEQFLNGQESDFDSNQNFDDEIQNRDFKDLYVDSDEAVGHQIRILEPKFFSVCVVSTD